MLYFPLNQIVYTIYIIHEKNNLGVDVLIGDSDEEECVYARNNPKNNHK